MSKSGLFRSLDLELNIPESYQFNVGFERELLKGIVFETNFTLNKTVGLWRDININAPVLPAGFKNLTEYLASINTGNVRFELGAANDTSGIRNSGGITYVNLNTTNNNNFTSATGAPTSPIAYALEAVKNLRPFAAQNLFTELERISSAGRSFYKGVTFELRKQRLITNHN